MISFSNATVKDYLLLFGQGASIVRYFSKRIMGFIECITSLD